MLLLVTIFLVVVGTISLVIGFVQTSLLPIYISIACSVLAAVVLLIFSRMTAKSQQVVTADRGPAPLDLGRTPAERTQPEPAYAGTGLLAGSSGGDSFAPDAGYGDTPSYAAADEDDDDLAEDDDFPIERYDTRRVGEILPLLAELDLDELDIVREHEEQGKGRATVLARIDQLIDQLEAEDRAEAASRFDEPAIPVAAPLRANDLDDVDDDSGLADEPADLQPVAPPPTTQAVSVAALPEDDGYFPIEDYDDLRASEILPLLPELDDDELVMVQQREQATVARSSILRRIDALLVPGSATPDPDPDPGPAPDLEMTPVVVPAAGPGDGPAKKAPAKRAPAARKAPAKKAPAAARVPAAKKVASAAPPVKKAPAAKKSVPTKAGRTGTAAKKARPVVEVAKAPAKKAAGRVAKAPAKKAPAEKVAAARAAAATKGGGTAKAAKATRKTTKR